MFSLKKKQQATADSGKKIRLVQVDDVQAANRSEKSLRFLALAADENDSATLLESLYLAKLLKRNHSGAHTSILAHRSHYRFLRRTGVFDQIHFIREPQKSAFKRARRIARLKPDLVFSARPDSKTNLAMWLSGVQFKLGSFQNSFWARFLRWFDVTTPADMERLARKDVRIGSDGARLSLPVIPAAELVYAEEAGPLAALGEVDDAPFVFLRFPEAGPRWPLSYLPRLARLCEADGLRIVAQLPASIPAEDLDYLNKEAASVVQLGELTTRQLISVIGKAEAVVGTGGSEKVLSSMLKRPIVVLNAPESAEEAAAETEDDIDRIVPLHEAGAGEKTSLLERIKARTRILHSWSGEVSEKPELDAISPELLVETLRESLSEA